MKHTGKIVILIAALVAILLVIGFLVTNGSGRREAVGVEPSSPVSSPAEPKPVLTKDPKPLKTPKPTFKEDDVAVPVPGNPLHVTLLLYPELGEISIEKLNKDGTSSGKPLKSGTRVQIVDPNKKGGKIQFTVP